MRSIFAVMNLERACRNLCSVLAHDESGNFVRRAYLGAVPLPIISCFHFARDHPCACGKHLPTPCAPLGVRVGHYAWKVAEQAVVPLVGVGGHT